MGMLVARVFASGVLLAGMLAVADCGAAPEVTTQSLQDKAAVCRAFFAGDDVENRETVLPADAGEVGRAAALYFRSVAFVAAGDWIATRPDIELVVSGRTDSPEFDCTLLDARGNVVAFHGGGGVGTVTLARTTKPTVFRIRSVVKNSGTDAPRVFDEVFEVDPALDRIFSARVAPTRSPRALVATYRQAADGSIEWLYGGQDVVVLAPDGLVLSMGFARCPVSATCAPVRMEELVRDGNRQLIEHRFELAGDAVTRRYASELNDRGDWLRRTATTTPRPAGEPDVTEVRYISYRH